MRILIVLLFFIIGCGVSRPFPERLRKAPVEYVRKLPSGSSKGAMGVYEPFSNRIFIKRPLSITDYIRLWFNGLNTQDIINHEYAHALDFWVYGNCPELWDESNRDMYYVTHGSAESMLYSNFRLEQFAVRVVDYLKGRDDKELESYFKEIKDEQ